MVRVLQAEENLRQITNIAAGNGLIKKHERDQILRTMRQDASMDKRKTGKKTTLADLLVPGIGLTVVKKGEPYRKIGVTDG